jgi:hypothetical protein
MRNLRIAPKVWAWLSGLIEDRAGSVGLAGCLCLPDGPPVPLRGP